MTIHLLNRIEVHAESCFDPDTGLYGQQNRTAYHCACGLAYPLKAENVYVLRGSPWCGPALSASSSECSECKRHWDDHRFALDEIRTKLLLLGVK